MFKSRSTYPSRTNTLFTIFHVFEVIFRTVGIIIILFSKSINVVSHWENKTGLLICTFVKQVKSECVLRSNSTTGKTSDNNYGRSWVFESDGTTTGPGGCNEYASTESLSALDHRRQPPVVAASATVCSRTVTLKRRAKPVVTPVVIVEVDGTTGGRPAAQLMTSFSRTPSPVGLSESTSQDSVSAAVAVVTTSTATAANIAAANSAPIYECLEKLTEPSVYRSRLNTALSASIQEAIASADRPPRSLSPRPPPAAEPVQYASLMEELQKTIGNRLSKHVESPEDR